MTQCVQSLKMIAPLFSKGKFGKLNIPITKFVPAKIIKRLSRYIQLKSREGIFNRLIHCLDSGQYPLILNQQICLMLQKPFESSAWRFFNAAPLFHLKLQMKKLHGVPKLITKRSVSFDPLQRKFNVSSLTCHNRKRKTQGIST